VSFTSEHTPRLADRLAAVRHQKFVGRQAERELFRSALMIDQPPYAVLHLYGPGGVGKTALLAEYAQIATEAHVPVLRLDGRDVEPSPPGLLRAVAQALELAEEASPLEALAQRPRCVLLVDTYELLTPLDTWLRESFLPQLPGQTVVVIAGRHPPAAPWRTDSGWSDLVRIVSLRNLPPEDSRAYLRVRGVSESQHSAVLEFTHGHPLALALVADLLAHGERETFSPEQAPDLMRVLLERFVQQVPSDAHRRALEICARTRVTTEALLADVLGAADVPALFAWLRGLSFVEQGAEGVFPHDLAREVLDADLRWRDPETFRDLHGRVLRYLVRQLQARSGREQQRAYFDLVYLSRNNPLMRPYYDWKSMGTAYAEPATPADFPAILEMVRRHDGEASARIAEYWLGRRPDAFVGFRGAGRQLIGFTTVLLLDVPDPEDCAADPAIEAVWRFVQRHGPLRPGERLMHHRFTVGRDAHQDLATTTLVATVGSIRWLTTPGLAWSFPVVADPAARERHFAAVGFPRAPEADFEVDDDATGCSPMTGGSSHRWPGSSGRGSSTRRSRPRGSLTPYGRGLPWWCSHSQISRRQYDAPSGTSPGWRRSPPIRCSARGSPRTTPGAGRRPPRSRPCSARPPRPCERIPGTRSCTVPSSAPISSRPPRRSWRPNCSGCRSAPTATT
jgi:hypothetical protein